jgi:hypothetical protein
VINRIVLALAIVVSGCSGPSADGDTVDGSLGPPAAPQAGPSDGSLFQPAPGHSPSDDASITAPDDEPGADASGAAGADAQAPADGPASGTSGDAGADVPATDASGNADADAQALADGEAGAEVFPDVDDPIFQGPWFPCPQGDYPEHTVVVKTHDDVVHTSSSTNIDAQVALPEGSFKAVALRVEHECPTGGICDLYDRRAHVQLVRQTDTGEESLELMRYVTTYRFNPGQTNYMCSWTDVTPYASLLTGQQTIRSSLDTVVGPGHELGDGWQVSIELVFYPGPAPGVSQILELYGKSIRIGAAPGSIDEETPPTSVMIPQDVTRVLARLTVSGHGWGPENTDNCAEFCRLDQSIRVNGAAPHVINPFRADCASNPLAPFQQRNPTGPRNGWCPGAVVLPHTVDITSEVTPGMPADIDFGVQRADGSEYIDADPTGFNPEEFVSLQLLMYSDGNP